MKLFNVEETRMEVSRLEANPIARKLGLCYLAIGIIIPVRLIHLSLQIWIYWYYYFHTRYVCLRWFQAVLYGVHWSRSDRVKTDTLKYSNCLFSNNIISVKSKKAMHKEKPWWLTNANQIAPKRTIDAVKDSCNLDNPWNS